MIVTICELFDRKLGKGTFGVGVDTATAKQDAFERFFGDLPLVRRHWYDGKVDAQYHVRVVKVPKLASEREL